MLKTINIKATTLSDAWFQLIYNCIEHGREFKIDQGSFKGQKRIELDYVTVQITHPDSLPLLPKLNPELGIPDPVEEGYLDNYLPYLMTGEEKEGEAYTYGQRICEEEINDSLFYKNKNNFIKDTYRLPQNVYWYNETTDLHYLNQMELMIWTYKNKGYRNNQMTLQVGKPTDMFLKDPPCLRHIDTRIQDNKLHFYPSYRSWDLFSGLPANLAAIELMKQYCASEIGVENGEIVASSKGIHLYDYTWELAEILRGKTIEEFKNLNKGD